MLKENLMSTNICYPTQETWFICWDNTRDNIKSYGCINTNQCMDTYWDEVDYYLNEAEWIQVLLQNGINPDPDADINQLLNP